MSLVLHRPCKPRLFLFSEVLLGLTALVLSVVLCSPSPPVWAQDNPEKPDKADKPDTADAPEKEKTDKDKADKDKKDEEEPQPPEDIDLASRLDSANGDTPPLDLKVTYYAGTKGQESIPVIIVHGFDAKEGKETIHHSRKDFTGAQGLAAFLQQQLGCAVVVPDLRGFGESIELQKTGDETEKLETKKEQEGQQEEIGGGPGKTEVGSLQEEAAEAGPRDGQAGPAGGERLSLEEEQREGSEHRQAGGHWRGRGRGVGHGFRRL